MAITTFNKLALYLHENGEGTIKLSFEEIEEILGFELPGSAKAFKTWWTLGDNKQVQAFARYGYKVINDPIADSFVIFKKYTAKKEATDNEEDKVIKEFKKEEQEKFEARRSDRPRRNFDHNKDERPRRDYDHKREDRPRNFDRNNRYE